MVDQIYLTELQLNKSNSFNTEDPCFDMHLSIMNGIVSSKIYDKRDYFNFSIVNFPFLDGDVARPPPPLLWCIYFAAFSFCESMFK